ncbi:hypothetical protein J2X69_003977 [Algoriphagus sp. 4150]|uniref:hypothetical protein n=1 Tax=Algoriphagus sp. 4150 TaxID=2817756 RepID=UPI00286638F4|nr:hypothetical protein [Algoriphagus sp. 4150]MDR7131613.1 hypothetical protein [Algoriphagus sp. 4150]
MKNLLSFGIILIISSLNLSLAQQTIHYEKFCKEICELLVTNNKSEFVKRFIPTKEDLLEFSYGTMAEKISKGECEGFFEAVTSTIEILEIDISSSFDFVYEKLQKNKILKVGNVEIRKSTTSKIGEIEVQNLFFVISDGQNQFKIELLGIYQASRDWIILSDIAPWYF